MPRNAGITSHVCKSPERTIFFDHIVQQYLELRSPLIRAQERYICVDSLLLVMGYLGYDSSASCRRVIRSKGLSSNVSLPRMPLVGTMLSEQGIDTIEL